MPLHYDSKYYIQADITPHGAIYFRKGYDSDPDFQRPISKFSRAECMSHLGYVHYGDHVPWHLVILYFFLFFGLQVSGILIQNQIFLKMNIGAINMHVFFGGLFFCLLFSFFQE